MHNTEEHNLRFKISFCETNLRYLYGEPESEARSGRAAGARQDASRFDRACERRAVGQAVLREAGAGYGQSGVGCGRGDDKLLDGVSLTAKGGIMSDMVAEQATGCRERVVAGGQFYDGQGNKISDTAARRLVREGEVVEAPNAGAGSYRAVARRLGYNKIEVEDWTSSAGDWYFRLHGGMFLFQNNRYPLCGFMYSVGRGC